MHLVLLFHCDYTATAAAQPPFRSLSVQFLLSGSLLDIFLCCASADWYMYHSPAPLYSCARTLLDWTLNKVRKAPPQSFHCNFISHPSINSTSFSWLLGCRLQCTGWSFWGGLLEFTSFWYRLINLNLKFICSEILIMIRIECSRI